MFGRLIKHFCRPCVLNPPEALNIKLQKLSGHTSGWSKKLEEQKDCERRTELNRWMVTERRWKRKAVSMTSPD